MLRGLNGTTQRQCQRWDFNVACAPVAKRPCMAICGALRPYLCAAHAQLDARYTLLKRKSRRWCEQRGRQVAPPPLKPQVEALIHEWFQLVRADREGCRAL